MEPEQSVDWNDIAAEVQLWIKATKPEVTHSAWAKMIRKKSTDHWIKQIAGDVEYQSTLSVANPPADEVLTATAAGPLNGHPEPTGGRRKRKLRAPSQRDSFDSGKNKQRARVETPMPLSISSKKARATAVARASIHGNAAADEAGAVAAAHVQASESLSTGIGSIHAGEGSWMVGRARQRSPPNSKLTFQSHHQTQIYIDALARSGLACLNSNPTGLYENSTIEELKHVAVNQSIPVATMSFGPLSSMAIAASPCPHRLLISQSLDEVATTSDKHMQAMQNAFVR